MSLLDVREELFVRRENFIACSALVGDLRMRISLMPSKARKVRIFVGAPGEVTAVNLVGDVTLLVVPQGLRVRITLLAVRALNLHLRLRLVSLHVLMEQAHSGEGNAADFAGCENFRSFGLIISAVVLVHVILQLHLLLRFVSAQIAGEPLVAVHHPPMLLAVRDELRSRSEEFAAHQADVHSIVDVRHVLYEVVVEVELHVACAAGSHHHRPTAVRLREVPPRTKPRLDDLLADHAEILAVPQDFEFELAGHSVPAAGFN